MCVVHLARGSQSKPSPVVFRFERARRVPQLIIADHHPELLEAADTRFRVTIDSDGKSHVEEIVSE